MYIKFCPGDVMVAMMVLEAIVVRRASSSLALGTILKHIAMPFRGGDHKESSVFQYGRETRRLKCIRDLCISPLMSGVLVRPTKFFAPFVYRLGHTLYK